jgi:RNA polymerase sigma-70 factor, ECF subfamily
MIGTLEKRPGRTVGQMKAIGEPKPKIDVNALVSRAQSGQIEAFGKLYEEYLDLVYRYVYLRTGQTEQAEDITQGVFIRAFESIENYRQLGKPFLGWLMRIAHNLIVDHYRWEKRHHTVPLPEGSLVSTRDPVITAEQNYELAEVKKAMTKLSAGQNEVFSLRFIAGLSVSEAAEITGNSVGAVKTLQHEAVVRLRKLMKE